MNTEQNPPLRELTKREKEIIQKSWEEYSASPIWLARDEYIPEMPHWYYVKNLDGSLSSRYWDDAMKVWYHSTASDGWTPNISITHWLYIPGVHGKHNQPIAITEQPWSKYL